MRKVNPELWLVLFLAIIAAALNFLVASQPMTLMFYFLPTLYSAYRFGRRHATLTALASVAVVVLITHYNSAVFARQVTLPFDSRWVDIALWGGILMVCSYAMGTLYEHNQENLLELKDGYDGMLVILRQFLLNQSFETSRPCRISVYAVQIAKALGLDAESTEHLRLAALLQHLNDAGIGNDVICKAVNLSKDDVEKGAGKRSKESVENLRDSLHGAIPLLTASQQLIKSGASTVDAPVEVQILVMAENFELMMSGKKNTPEQAQEFIYKTSSEKYDSLIVDAFVKAFYQKPKTEAAKV